MSSHFATPRKPQPPTFWVEPATQKPADNPVDVAGYSAVTPSSPHFAVTWPN